MSLSYRAPALLLTWGVFIALAIGSKSYDPEEPIVRDPVDYTVSISNIGSVVLENGDTTDTLSAVTLTGVYNQAGGSAPTLRSGGVVFNTSSEFDIDVEPTDADNTLRGNIQVTVNQSLTFDNDRTVQTGQLSVLFGGTTTLVTFPSDSSDVQLQTGTNAAVTISLDELRERFSDEDQELNLRAASKSWSTFENLWLTARITETVHREIDSQLSMLTSMGRNQPLTVACDNPTATPTPEHTLNWTTDAAGIGSGEAGNDDSFDSVSRNCSYASDGRFLQGDLTLADYIYRKAETELQQMSFDAEASNLFIARENIDTSTTALVRERIDGTLRINVAEQSPPP